MESSLVRCDSFIFYKDSTHMFTGSSCVKTENIYFQDHIIYINCVRSTLVSSRRNLSPK